MFIKLVQSYLILTSMIFSMLGAKDWVKGLAQDRQVLYTERLHISSLEKKPELFEEMTYSKAGTYCSIRK